MDTNIIPEEPPRGFAAIHTKLNILWTLLTAMAIVEGFPRNYIDDVRKERERINQ